jgi:hypothetical protein
MEIQESNCLDREFLEARLSRSHGGEPSEQEQLRNLDAEDHKYRKPRRRELAV